MESKKYIFNEIQSKSNSSKIQISAFFSMLGLLSLCLVYSSLAQAWTFEDDSRDDNSWQWTKDGDISYRSREPMQTIAQCLLDNRDQTTSPEPEDYWFYRSSKKSERKCEPGYWGWSTYFYPVGDLIHSKQHGLSPDKSKTKIQIQFSNYYPDKGYGGYMAPYDFSSDEYLNSQSKPHLYDIEYVYKLSVKLGESWVDIENLPIIDFSRNRSIQVDQKTISQSIDKYQSNRHYKSLADVQSALNYPFLSKNRKKIEEQIQQVQSMLKVSTDGLEYLEKIRPTANYKFGNEVGKIVDQQYLKALEVVKELKASFANLKKSQRTNNDYLCVAALVNESIKDPKDRNKTPEECGQSGKEFKNFGEESSIAGLITKVKSMIVSIGGAIDLWNSQEYRLRVCSYSYAGRHFICEQLESDIALLSYALFDAS